MQAARCQDQGAFRVKNTFVHAEPIVQKCEFDLGGLPCFWRQESEPALFSRALTRTATARKAFVAARLLSSGGQDNTNVGHVGTKLAGQSPTAETMDECGPELTEFDGSESDQSSETEWEACAVLEQMADLTDPVDVLDQAADLTESVGLVEELGDISEPLQLPEQPEDFSWEVSFAPVAAGDLCRQTTEQCWPTYDYVDHASTVAGDVEPHGQANSDHVVENSQLCFAPPLPIMWPAKPLTAMYIGSVAHMDVGAARQHTSTNAMRKGRRSKRKFNPMSLISLAEQAQQKKWEEQHLKMQQQFARCQALHAIQLGEKQEQHQKPPRGFNSNETTVPNMAMPKFCTNCGNGILPHFKCCPFCGSALNLATSPTVDSD